MDDSNNLEFERAQCMMLKAFVVSHMTSEVKNKISAEGYTPAEIATAYILKTYKNLASVIFDPHQVLLHVTPLHLPEYQRFIYNESGEVIIDVIF